jgi:hypothetical protein
MTESTMRLVEGLYPCVPLGARELKGKGSVTLYTVDRGTAGDGLPRELESLEELSEP